MVLGALAVVGAFIAAGELASRRLDFPVELLWQDPASSLRGAFYTGAMTYLAVLAWWTAATAGLFAWWLLRSAPGMHRTAGLLGSLGAFSAVLGLDDLFMLHERVAPVHFGVPEAFILLAWMGALLLILVRFRESVLDTLDPVLFASSGTALAVMLALDQSLPDSPPQVVIEEGCKLLGALLWAACIFDAAARAVRRTHPAAAPGYSDGQEAARGEADLRRSEAGPG